MISPQMPRLFERYNRLQDEYDFTLTKTQSHHLHAERRRDDFILPKSPNRLAEVAKSIDFLFHHHHDLLPRSRKFKTLGTTRRTMQLVPTTIESAGGQESRDEAVDVKLRRQCRSRANHCAQRSLAALRDVANSFEESRHFMTSSA